MTISDIFKSQTDVVDVDNKTERVNKQQSAEHETNYFRVLPLLSYKNDHHKEVLSLKENEYLRLRWQKFLSDKPTGYVRIRLYRDQMKTIIIPRRMQLNGRFYGVDNKLSPAPVIPVPRMI